MTKITLPPCESFDGKGGCFWAAIGKPCGFVNNQPACSEYVPACGDYPTGFDAVAPDMPLGNVPSDPELQRLCVLYHKANGEPWDGDAEKLREWAKGFDTSIPDKPPEPASRRVVEAAGGPE